MAIPIAMFIRPDVYDVSLVQRSAVVATGILSVFAVVLCLYALDLDEASFITPFYQTVPILLTKLVCAPRYRRDFLGLFKRQKVAVVGLIALSETLFSVSEAVTLYATLLVPVALVLLVNSFQPLFVFTLGIVLTLFLPRVAQESLGPMKMLQKGVGIGLMLVGGYFISR